MSSMIFHEAVVCSVLERPNGSERLLLDIEAILAGTAPTSQDLEDAPVLDHWIPVVSSNLITLAGRVERHPIRSNGLIVTSTLCAIDPVKFVWARTVSRFYRLGKHFGGAEILGRAV